MKKLMTMIGVAAMAFGLYADFKYNQTDFKDTPLGALDINKNDAGNDDPPLYWSGEAGDSEIKQVDSAKFLAIDNSEPLYRTVNTKGADVEAEPETIGTGVFADMNVKFTAGDAEEEIVVADGAKLGLCVVADEEGNTNLIVKAAALIKGEDDPVATNFVLNVDDDFDFDATHRVTIRAIDQIGEGTGMAGFLIYLDGVDGVDSAPVAAADSDYAEKMGAYKFSSVAQPFATAKQLFPSLVAAGTDEAQTIYGIGFKGSGELASVALTDADHAPSFAKPAVDVTIAWDAGVTGYTYNIGAGEVTEPVSGAGSATITLPNAATLVTIDFTVGEAFVKGEIDPTDMELDTEKNAWKYTGSNAKLALNSAPVAYTIGTEKYATFEDALEAAIAAKESTTIKLAASIDGWEGEQRVESADADVTLDLAGYTLTFKDYTDVGILTATAGKLTVISSVAGGKMVVTNPDSQFEGIFYGDGGDIIIGAAEGDEGATFEGYIGESLGTDGGIVNGSFDKAKNEQDALTDFLVDGENYEIVEDETKAYWTVAEKQAEEPVYCYAEVWLNGVKTEQKAAPGDGDHKYAPGTQVTVENAAFFENALFGNGILYVSKMTDADGKEATFSFDGTTFAKVSGDLEVTYDSGKLSMTVTTKGAVAPATEEVLGKIELTTFKQKCYAEVVFDSEVVGTAQPGDGDHMYAKGDVAQIVNLGVITTEQVAGLDLPEGTYYVKEATDGEKTWTFSYDGTTFEKESGDDSITVSGNVITMSLTVGENAKLGTITLAKYEKQEDWDVPSGSEDKPASQVWETIPSNLADVPAGKLSTWAKANNVPFGGEFTETMSDAYLLNCAPTAEKVAEEKAKINIASIEFVDNEWVIKTVSEDEAGDEFGNGELELVDVTKDVTGAEGSDATKLWKMKLVPITATKE